MTPFTPKTVINWYKARPKWLKVILALVLIIPLALAAIWWFLGEATQPTPADITKIQEKHDDERRQEAEQRDKEYAEEIAALEKARLEKQKAKQKLMEGNAESHEEIDNNNGNIFDHVDDYNKGRRSRD